MHTPFFPGLGNQELAGIGFMWEGEDLKQTRVAAISAQREGSMCMPEEDKGKYFNDI